MNSSEIPQGAIKLIEELLDENSYGRKSIEGNYYFPLCRKARIKQLTDDYNIAFPYGLPEPYLTMYFDSIKPFVGELL